MDKFDRELQSSLLNLAMKSYPRRTTVEMFNNAGISLDDDKKVLANIYYLIGHGLLQTNEASMRSFDLTMMLNSLTATKDGIDFLLNDGGLSAILKVQTVKLHRETIVVLEDLIAISNLSEQEKEKAKSKLGEMSTEALKAVVSTVTTAGLSMLLGK